VARAIEVVGPRELGEVVRKLRREERVEVLGTIADGRQIPFPAHPAKRSLSSFRY